jgi:hypothetical protein
MACEGGDVRFRVWVPLLTVKARDGSLVEVPGARVRQLIEFAHYGQTLLIPGTASPAHLAQNPAAGGRRASPAARDQLAGFLAG